MTSLSLPSAAAQRPRPRLTSAPSAIDIIEERQRGHLLGLDAAYFEGFCVMREASGQELSEKNLLADGYSSYLTTHAALLSRCLAEQRERREALQHFSPRNRFLLGADSATAGVATSARAPSLGADAAGAAASAAPSRAATSQMVVDEGEGARNAIMASVGSCAAIAPSTSAGPPIAGSYMAWRRQLLAYRFEKRRAALTNELVRRLADEAMKCAVEAEARER